MSMLNNLIRPDLQNFKPYSSARDEAHQGHIWLNANESPYDFTVAENLSLNRYPQNLAGNLLMQIARHYQVQEDQLVLSRGSDEVIDLLTRLLCRAGKDSVITCPPTFGMYSVCAQLQGAKTLEVPLIKEQGFQLDIPGIIAAWDPTVKIIFLCSPNNPSGNLLKQEDIFFLCEKFQDQSLVVVDEAYIEFATAPSLATSINHYENLVILRTFSKAYGLAGARAGLLLAQPELVQWIEKIIPPYPLTAHTLKIIEETLSPVRLQQIKHQIAEINQEKKRLLEKLAHSPLIHKVWPSEANFILVETSDANQFMRLCQDNQLIVRNMDPKPGLKNCIRISIGLPQENQQLIAMLQKENV